MSPINLAFTMLVRLTCILFLYAGASWAGIPDRISWSEMGRVVGHRVLVTLPDGTVLSGKARQVVSDSLIVNVKQSGNEALHPRGRTEIPRASFKELRVSRDTARWRIIGTSTGIVLGFGIAIGCAAANILSTSNSCGTVLVVGVAGLGGGGYLIGNAADHRMKTVAIIE